MIGTNGILVEETQDEQCAYRNMKLKLKLKASNDGINLALNGSDRSWS